MVTEGMVSGVGRTGMVSGVGRTGMVSGVGRTGMVSGVGRTGTMPVDWCWKDRHVDCCLIDNASYWDHGCKNCASHI